MQECRFLAPQGTLTTYYTFLRCVYDCRLALFTMPLHGTLCMLLQDNSELSLQPRDHLAIPFIANSKTDLRP